MRTIATNLTELYLWREKCDYRNTVYDAKTLDQMALEAINDAQEIIDILK